ncbi:hypothetical protein ACIQ57_12900 [Lysinibacillus xylanilyticus]|uniref:hypothetical protein n=1 Tax=Lysinibacillus xylanilyticus TaxID=582475 RepID=UPI00381CEBA6
MLKYIPYILVDWNGGWATSWEPATATNVFYAKAKRQQQMFSMRKRSDSNKTPRRNENQPRVMVMRLC